MYRKTVLDNSVRIVTEELPSRTVSVGVWIDTGSRDEDEYNNGCAHFVEHMLFKGTENRTARQIAKELDMLGGLSNAFTSTEQTCIYATVLDSHLERTVDLLADLFLRSVFSSDEIESERQVILQEIAMVEDTPDDKVHEAFSALIWPGHPLGNTVLGAAEVVANITSETLQEYVRNHYLAERITIVAAGKVEHQAFVNSWRKQLGGIKPSQSTPVRLPPKADPLRSEVITKPLEQTHLVIGQKGLPIVSDDRYKLLLMNIILGGNMSSRLYQEIREKRGLAYSVYSYLVSYSDSGYAAIYMGVDSSSICEVIGLVKNEFMKMITEPVSDEELLRAVEYAKGGMYLSSENMESRMTRLARNEMFFGRDISIDEVAANLEAVVPENIRDISKSIFNPDQLSISAIGPIDQETLKCVDL